MIALHDHARGRRAGARWWRRWLDAATNATIDQAAFVVGCLVRSAGRARASAFRPSGTRPEWPLAEGDQAAYRLKRGGRLTRAAAGRSAPPGRFARKAP